MATTSSTPLDTARTLLDEARTKITKTGFENTVSLAQVWALISVAESLETIAVGVKNPQGIR